MRLSEKHEKEYLKKNKTIAAIIKRIIEEEERSKVELLDWTTENVKEFLRSFKSISVVSLMHNLTILRKYSEYICKKENLKNREYSIEVNSAHDLIDFDKLMEVTISYEQFQYIRKVLSINGNTRDKLIISLAWSGLSNEEIKMLKEKDIEFKKSKYYDFEIVYLNINNGEKQIRIEDPEIVNDIRQCKMEKCYYLISKDGKQKKYDFRESDYLIKPINVGKNKTELYLNNPSITLQSVFLALNIKVEGIKMSDLSIEDIRRSKIVYLLSPHNKKYFDADFISIMYYLANPTSLNWLKKISDKKYGE